MSSESSSPQNINPNPNSLMSSILTFKFWAPDFPEISIFILFIMILFFTLILFHYGEVQRHVAKSRCALQTKSKVSGIYSVSAVNANNDKLYHVDYNFDAKTFNVECDCDEGDVVNTFKNINTYDLKSNRGTDSIKVIDKACNCTKYYDSEYDNVYYNGEPGLIRFMNQKDISFFNQSLL